MPEMTASEVIALKTKVKAEMQRRQYSGSLIAYAGTAYDFPTTPTSKQPMTAGQGNAVITPLLAVAPLGDLGIPSSGSIVPGSFDYTTMNNQISALSAIAVTSSSTGCAASCTGLCYGCTGSCTGGCSGNCKGGCKGCDSTCTGECSGQCTGKCTNCTGCQSCNGRYSIGICDTSGGCNGGCNSSCTSCNGCFGGCSGVRQSSGS